MDFALIAQASSLPPLLANLMSYGMAIAGLGFVIFVHELGHFLVAKSCGVKCEKFYLGFDAFEIPLGPVTIPAKLVHFQWGETEYGIGILPLGGYVKMLGQDDNPQAQAEENERVRLPVHKSDVKLVSAGGPDEAADSGTAKQQEIAKGLAAEGLVSGQTIEGSGEPQRQLDPRSYQAKSVPQRMAIISAGVIFNLIFAVIFATIAYAIGVPYTPAEIGGTQPGLPAWVADVRAGDRIVRIGKDGEEDRHIRFEHDLMQEIQMAALRGEAIDLNVLRGDQTINLSLKPKKVGKNEILGIGAPQTLRLARKPTAPGYPAAKAEPGFLAGDEVVAVKVGGQRSDVKTMGELQEILAQHFDEPLTFIVSRKSPDTGETTSAAIEAPRVEAAVEVQPNPAKHLGIVMRMGPIMAVQQGSPAAVAGLSRDDKLVSINGEPIPDPLQLDAWLKPHWGKEIEVGYERVDASGTPQPGKVKLTLRAPRSSHSGAAALPVGSDSLGVAYWVTNIVGDANGPVTEGAKGIKPGDEVVEVQFIPGDEKERELLDDLDALKTINLSADEANWPKVMSILQVAPPDAKVKLRYKRKDLHYVTVAPQVQPRTFEPQRGMIFELMKETHTAASFGEAVGLGFRETGESLLRVVSFLRALVTTPAVAKNAGSVLTIFAAASGEASVGWTRLLVFLTFLSANLAIINILPIPVLDGGHLMFLAAEGIRGKPVDENLQIRLTLAGFVFLLCVMVLAFGNDILRFTGLGG